MAEDSVSEFPLETGAMSPVSAIATSGIRAASMRLQAAAGNIAKAGDVGLTRVPRAATLGNDFNPAARASEAWHFRANPYVSLTNEMVQVLVARFDLVASAHVLRVDAQTSAALLDVKI
jgi:hypothetical protein